MFNPLEYDLEGDENATGQYALDTTLITSHVCHSWRNILLESPSIWGQVLRLERLRQLDEEVREEIVKRTGNAPLYLLGHIFGKENFGLKFFEPLLRNNWSRIRKLHVKIVGVGSSKASFPKLCLQPAPSMESFKVHFEGISVQPFSKSASLFSGEAPLLRELGISLQDFPFNLQGSWINQLRILELTTSQVNALDVVEAVNQTPHLQLLSLTDIAGHPNFKTINPKTIILPHLIDLRLNAHFQIVIAFALGIKPAACCTLQLNTVMRQELLPGDVIAMSEILTRYGEPYFSVWTALSLDINIDLYTFSFTVVQVEEPLPPIASSGFTTFSTFHIGVTSSFPLTEDSSILLTPFLECNLSTVQDLDIRLASYGEATPFLHVDPFLRSLSELETLRTNSLGLGSLGQKEVTGPEPLLPNLQTLRLANYTAGDQSFQENFWKFYNYRKNCLLPIPTLDCEQDPNYDFTFLETAKELKVTWQKGEISSEYICGSGDKGKLNFSLV